MTDSWQRHEISNFEYLMYLNTIAGRTYHDLTQYPVMPWILADYTSEKLDLSNPASFRDLSHPIGALNEYRRAHCREQYEIFNDEEIPKFHHGTHYSNIGQVLYFLLRLEPFTSVGVDLQGGHFDYPERLFHSIPQAWKNLQDNFNDVKELTPEFFYMPEFLCNSNGFNFGLMEHTKLPVGDVVLPPWAKNAVDFVHQHRLALESDHVSQHLHEWIDLIFGYKQRGEAAVEACNVYFYLTYEDGVDMDKVTDPTVRRAMETQVANFGQTPTCLFSRPHPHRHSKPTIGRSLSKAAKERLSRVQISESALWAVMTTGSSIILIDHDKRVHCLEFSVGYLDQVLDVDAIDRLSPVRLMLDLPIWNQLESYVKPPCVASADGKLLFTGAHSDHSLKVLSVSTGHVVHSMASHHGAITCLALNGNVLVSGGSDGLILVWDIKDVQPAGASALVRSRLSSSILTGLVSKDTEPGTVGDKHLRSVLRGHIDTVSSVAVCTKLGLVVSGSTEATLLWHSLHTADCSRAVVLKDSPPITSICFCRESTMLAVSSLQQNHPVFLYTVNGALISQICVSIYHPVALQVCDEKRHLYVVGARSMIVLDTSSLKVIKSFDLDHGVMCAGIFNHDCVVYGDADGFLHTAVLEKHATDTPGRRETLVAQSGSMTLPLAVERTPDMSANGS